MLGASAPFFVPVVLTGYRATENDGVMTTTLSPRQLKAMLKVPLLAPLLLKLLLCPHFLLAAIRYHLALSFLG
ncbi:hypothetical protein GCM10023078_25520 [Gibbsiella greigii]